MLEETVNTIFSVLDDMLPDANVEIIAVDDGSTDGTFDRLIELRKEFSDRLRVIRLSRNFGALCASQAGIDHAHGDCVANISQDLQDTPEMIAAMFRSWRDENSKANFTVRTSERDEPVSKKTMANLYHRLFRFLVMPNYPINGLGVYLIDRQIADELRKNRERNLDIATYVFSLGYNCKLHPFPRPAPKLKRSGWTFSKNIKLAIDNFTTFSYLPIRIMSMMGIIVAAGSFLFAVYVFTGKLTGWYPINQPPGWATIIVLLTFLMGLVMIMLGIIGEYLWRTLDAARNRPIYVVDEIHED